MGLKLTNRVKDIFKKNTKILDIEGIGGTRGVLFNKKHVQEYGEQATQSRPEEESIRITNEELFINEAFDIFRKSLWLNNGGGSVSEGKLTVEGNIGLNEVIGRLLVGEESGDIATLEMRFMLTQVGGGGAEFQGSRLEIGFGAGLPGQYCAFRKKAGSVDWVGELHRNGVTKDETAGFSISKNVWHILKIIWDITNDSAEFFVDKASKGTASGVSLTANTTIDYFANSGDAGTIINLIFDWTSLKITQ